MSREDVWKLLRRSKMYLSLRYASPELVAELDKRRRWNKDQRLIVTLLDLFPSLKYSYSSMLPVAHRRGVVKIVGSGGRGIPKAGSTAGFDSDVGDFANNGDFVSVGGVGGVALGEGAVAGGLATDCGLASAPLPALEQPLPLLEGMGKVSPPRSCDTNNGIKSQSCSNATGDNDYHNTNGGGQNLTPEQTLASKVRIDDIARSHSIRLDPVDARKELFKYRIRIQRVLAWAYQHNLVPVMMTLTVFHRWNPLADILDVLLKSRAALFQGAQGQRYMHEIGLEGYVQRLEETINDRDDEDGNSGWHPHLHVILLVPKQKLEALDQLESALQIRWAMLVNRYYERQFGKKIDPLFLPAFCQHGLVLSRIKKGEDAGKLRPVKDGKYMAKILGCDKVFGGDDELTSPLKDSKIPFDLLREVSSTNIDLWCEYAIAMKGVPAFRFSQGLENKVKGFFKKFPSKNPSPDKPLPTEQTLLELNKDVFHFFYRHFQIPNLLEKAKQGFDAVKTWAKDTFNIDIYKSFSFLNDVSPRAPTDDPPDAPLPPPGQLTLF